MATVTVTPSQVEDLFDGRAGDFSVAIDRGEVNAPRSIELVLLGLGACTIATVQHYLKRKGMSVDGLAVHVTSELDKAANAYGGFQIALSLDDRFTDDERRAILGVARTCRIHKTLTSPLQIDVVPALSAGEPTAMGGAVTAEHG